MALLGSVHVGFVRSEENESQQTFHKALCYLCNRELKTTCSSMIACACGMNKRSVECECVCMQLMSDWSVDGMTAIVLHWLCATQVKKLTVLSYYKAHKYSSKLILHHPVSPVIQRVCVCAHVCVCVCVCVCALVWVKLLPICGMLGLFCDIFILHFLPGFFFHVAARKPEEGFKGTSLVSSWWHNVSWLRVWQIEPSEQLMTQCFLAPCVTNQGLWAADDTMFPGCVCDKSSLVSSWWPRVSRLRVWQIEPSEQLMTPCFLAPCVTIWGLWAADTMFPGSVCDNLRLVSSWWHHVSWFRVWQFEACEQLMTPCFLVPCVTNQGLWAADDTMFPGSMCDRSSLVSSWWPRVSWLRVWQIEPCEQLTPCFLAPCVTNRVLWAADDIMFPDSMCDKSSLVNSWWPCVSWLYVWQIGTQFAWM